MDNLTHTLTSVALSQAGLNRKTRFATLALVIGANLPDLDIVARLGGSATYLQYHRGITHSILGAVVLSVLLAGTIYYLGRSAKPPKKRDTPPLRPCWLLGICLVAVASHILLDLTNSFGVRVLIPFGGRWYAWDILYIIDPVLLALLTAGLALPAIFRLVSEEVGARKPGFQRGAIFSLCCLVLLCGLRGFAHRRALGMLESHTYGGETPRRLGAFPSPADPFSWTGVVETDSAFHVLQVNAREDDVDAEHTVVFRKLEPSAILDSAMKARTAVIFADFARFLWRQAEETEDGYDVTLHDLRFYSRGGWHPPFVVNIHLDKSLRVRSESFDFLGEGQGR
jgi:inner membrane protein